MAPQQTVIVDPSPPSYPGGYGTIEVHHHHHHTLRTRGRRSSACCKALFITLLIVVIMASFSAACFAAWNFYNLAECEKQRLPWEKPCKDWLGRDSLS